MLVELKWLATAALKEGQIHTFPKRENTTELYCQQSPTMGELEKSCLVTSRNHTKCLFPPYLNLPLVDRPGLPGTLMQSGRCHGKSPYHWRSVQQLLPSPWSERRLLLDHSSNAARCDLSHSQGSSQVPARASPLTALRLHMHWRWKEGRDGVRETEALGQELCISQQENVSETWPGKQIAYGGRRITLSGYVCLILARAW